MCVHDVVLQNYHNMYVRHESLKAGGTAASSSAPSYLHHQCEYHFEVRRKGRGGVWNLIGHDCVVGVDCAVVVVVYCCCWFNVVVVDCCCC